jgi:hypothetical protein
MAEDAKFAQATGFHTDIYPQHKMQQSVSKQIVRFLDFEDQHLPKILWESNTRIVSKVSTRPAPALVLLLWKRSRKCRILKEQSTEWRFKKVIYRKVNL